MKNAVITGANRGIGLCITKEFAENGINVWACARKKSAEFENELNGLSDKTGVVVKPLYFDITDRQASKAAAMSVYKTAGSIDILVNNAGISEDSLFLMTSIDKMEQMFNTNFFSPLYFTQIVAKLMIEKAF